MNKKKETMNPWKPEDEREHYPCPIEWWSTEAFLKNVKTKNDINFKATFTQWHDNPKVIGSMYRTVILDVETGKYYNHMERDDTKKLESKPNEFYLQFKNSYITGLYPDYNMKFIDSEHDVETVLNYHAEVLPHVVGKDITDGYLPMGLGTYRYAYLPKIKVTGTIKQNGKTSKVEGTGYAEHVWGSFSYDNPFARNSQLRKAFTTYVKLAARWINNHKIGIPKSIYFTTENNPFGYDWLWGVLDNGWTVFYGNSLFYIMKGPALGYLIISKDGKKYQEYSDITFHYNKINYNKKYDFTYPAEFELTAKNGNERLFLHFKNIKPYLEHINLYPFAKHRWIGFAICEAPGTVKGYHCDKNKKTEVTGICRLEPQRQISKLGHNMLKLDFKRPPEGFGIKIDLKSHYLKKRMMTQIQLAPRPKLKFSIKKITEKDFSKIDY